MNLVSGALKVLIFVVLIFIQSEELEWVNDVFGKYDYYLIVMVRFATFLLGFSILRDWLIRLYRRRVPIPSRQDNFTLGLSHIYNMVFLAGVVVTLMALFKVDIKQFFISMTVIAAAIAIVSKDYISNVINGMIITFSDELSLGDQVKIDDYKGKIININLLNMHLLNDDDDLIYIPNNTVFNATVLNYTKRETKKISIEFVLNINNLQPVEILEKELASHLSEYSQHIVPNSFRLKVEEINKDAVTLKFQYVLKEQDKELEKEIRRKTVRKVVEMLNEKP
ncbi:MAG: mechanosensitive ion channel [Saprospiraceae bacterium]